MYGVYDDLTIMVENACHFNGEDSWIGTLGSSILYFFSTLMSPQCAPQTPFLLYAPLPHQGANRGDVRGSLGGNRGTAGAERNSGELLRGERLTSNQYWLYLDESTKVRDALRRNSLAFSNLCSSHLLLSWKLLDRDEFDIIQARLSYLRHLPTTPVLLPVLTLRETLPPEETNVPEELRETGEGRMQTRGRRVEARSDGLETRSRRTTETRKQTRSRSMESGTGGQRMDTRGTQAHAVQTRLQEVETRGQGVRTCAGRRGSVDSDESPLGPTRRTQSPSKRRRIDPAYAESSDEERIYARLRSRTRR